MSNEHVIRSAISKYLPSPPTKTNWPQKYLSPEDGRMVERHRQLPRSPLQATINDVCKECNEGWLEAKVEVPVENELEALIKGIPLNLSPPALLQICTWASKTAMVRARLDRQPYPIPAEHHKYLMENLAPPPGTYVWLAATEYEPNTYIRQYKFQIYNSGDPIGVGHLTTIIIGHMGLFILGSDGSSTNDVLQSAIKRIESYDLVRLHPSSFSGPWFRLQKMPLDLAISLSSTMEFLVNNFQMEWRELAVC